jgi:hypothetical protein
MIPTAPKISCFHYFRHSGNYACVLQNDNYEDYVSCLRWRDFRQRKELHKSFVLNRNYAMETVYDKATQCLSVLINKQTFSCCDQAEQSKPMRSERALEQDAE